MNRRSLLAALALLTVGVVASIFTLPLVAPLANAQNALVIRTPIWGDFTSTDASALSEANARILLYKDVSGTPTAVTLASTDIVEITDLTVWTGTSVAITVTVYSGADNVVDAGEIVHKSFHVAAGTTMIAANYKTPHRVKPGTYPKVAGSGSSAAGMGVQIKGYLIQNAAN